MVLARLGGVSRLCLVLALAALLLGGCGEPRAEPEAEPLVAGSGDDRPGSTEASLEDVAPVRAAPAARAASSSASTLGPGEHPAADLPGFLVWESNRSGAWRLWVRDLEGSAPRLLTADEPRRRHCCAHVAPDGGWIAYLSLPDGKQEYPKGGSSGPLHLIRPDGSEERQLVAEARTYFEHRAAVWRSVNELIYIDGQGRTALIDVESGEQRLLTREALPEYGWLINSELSWATNGRAQFSSVDVDRGQVALRHDKIGCQPYFSHDGRWGFWTAGVGGPINRLELATDETAAIIHKNDERMPVGLGYLYFPMLSRDGSMLAFAASRDEHDHFRSDYEIFVAEVDPENLELLGDPVRMSGDSATDRFPDVHVEALELERRTGEAPLTAEWQAPAAGEWRWHFGDGGSAEGVRADHRFEQPGRFEVTATDGSRRLRGLAIVRPARPPRALRAVSRDGGRRVEVSFDEPVAPASPSLRFASGATIRDWSLAADGRSLSIALAEPLRGGDSLQLEGFADRAERPNPLSPVALEIAPPLWPSGREGLAFLWANGAAPNLVFDPALDAERASVVTPQGRAILNRDLAMVLGRGRFVASAEDMDAVVRATRGSNRISLEAYATPGASGSLLRMGGLHLNFALRAEAGRIHFSMRTGIRGPGAFQGATVASYEPGQSLHLVVTYAPGRLVAYVDGERVGEWPLSGDFFHWKRYPLVFGEDVTAAPGTTPLLEGVAIYSRILSAEEVRENHQRYRAALAARPAVARAEVEARLTRRTGVPSLEQISPYREALVVDEWEVIRIVSGAHDGGRTRIARWAILDGQPEPVVTEGTELRLTLERFDQNPQLEGVFVADELGSGGLTYYAVD